MSLPPPLDREILFFGGKGGVGKTTLAAATALHLAGERIPTLLVSTDPAHSAGDILEADLGPEPRPVVADLRALELDPAREADRYIRRVKERIAGATAPRLMREVERQIDAARVSPGAEEAALFDRFTRILEEEAEGYDRVVFDTAPTGQTLRLLSLPELMSAWIGGLIGRRKKVTSLGRMWRNVAGAAAEEAPGEEDPVLRALEERRSRFHRARGILTDPSRTGFLFVVVPERLPVRETERAARTLSDHGIPVAAIVANQLLPPDAELADAGFLAGRRDRQAEHLARIEDTLGDWPLFRVELRREEPVGIEPLRAVGAELWAADPARGRGGEGGQG